MVRPLRVEYPGAIYHVMSRGNGRQRLFRDERGFERLLAGLESAVRKFAWLVMNYVASARLRIEKQLINTPNRA